MDNESSSSESNNKKRISDLSSPKKSNKSYNIENSPKSNLEEEELANYCEYINECLINNEENRQNFFNSLEDLKLKTNEIKSNNLKNAEYAITLLEEFIKMCDENYSIFAKTKEILTKFNDLNDASQNINFSYQKLHYSISYFKEMNEKLNKDMKKLEEQNQKLKDKIKDIKTNIQIEKENYINLINEKDKEKKEEINNNNKEIKNQMDNLIEENQELKRKYSQVITESGKKKQENTQRMSCLLNQIDAYKNKIDNLQNRIYEIENEKQKEIIQEKEKEENIINEKENIINLENPKSYISDNSSNKQGINLEDLLDNDNPGENEEKSDEEEKKVENKSEKSEKPIKYSDYDMDFDNKPNIFSLCPISKKDKKDNASLKRNNLKVYKSPFSLLSSPQSSKLNNTKKDKNAKSVYAGKSKIKDSKNEYQIFFFLLLKSIIINYNISEYFQKKDFALLFKECQNEKIEFNQYQEWILNKLNLNEKENKIEKNHYYIDSNFIDSFICSSMI